ncbi:MAG: hypothetical protein J5765_02475 [Clostridia bacterium]|nr:hypothetical protein [Clostridia bacterium]
MKRIAIITLIVCFAAALSVGCFSGCSLFKSISLDEAKTNLESAGYEVTVMSGKEYVESDNNPYPFIMEFELDHYLYAVKGEDVIHLYFFSTIDDASDNYDFMTGEKGQTSGQKNELVYFGTKQAISDAKI